MEESSLNYLLTLDEPLEPETIRALGLEKDTLEVQKVLVIKLLKDSDLPYKNFYIFENCVHTLNGVEADIDKLEGSKPHHIWKSLDYMKNMKPDFKLSREIKKYIEFQFKDRGFRFFPPHSGLANPEWYKDMVEKANDEEQHPIKSQKPFDLQVIKYMKIREYLNRD